jgi:hypothetical protein
MYHKVYNTINTLCNTCKKQLNSVVTVWVVGVGVTTSRRAVELVRL